MDAFERAKRTLLGALAATVAGLAIAGTVHKTLGGVIVVAGWAASIASLHRLGRAGSVKRDRPRDAR